VTRHRLASTNEAAHGPYEWPKFAEHLTAVERSPEDRLRSLLASLGASGSTPDAHEVLATLFDDISLVDDITSLGPRLHHTGLVAPAALDVGTITNVLRESSFGEHIWQYESVVLAKDLSSRLGHRVDVSVVQGSAAAPSARCPAVEVFVADLPATTLRELVERETGCHVALELESGEALGRVCDVLHAHDCWEIPLMRGSPLTNREIGFSLLYVDVPGGGRTRRLEFIAPSKAGS
jgi:hypothetical protein